MRKLLVFIFLIPLLFGSCKRDFGTYYDPPEGQEMIYDKLAKDSVRFSTFIDAIDMVPGLKKEFNASGLYTVLAPDNTAFNVFFAEHPRFKSLNAIPADTLEMIVKYHILKFMLFKVNFLNPGISKIEYDKFKYETRASLVYKDRDPSGQLKVLFYPSKNLNIYTPDFFRLKGLTSQDYADVYGSGSAVSTKSGVNANGASFTEFDISCGNGVIHMIDKVLMPPPTIAQELDNNPEYSRLSSILKRQFVDYIYNAEATKAQGNNGDVDGDGRTDSLWSRSYVFNKYIDDENPKVVTTDISLTAYIPSKEAFDNYLNTKLIPDFKNNLDSIPNRTLKLLYQAFFSNMANWPSKISDGRITNLLGDVISISKSDINNIKMASNGLIYQTNKVMEPNAFTGVTGPSFLNLRYWYFGEMLLQSGVLSDLTKSGTKFTILCPTNQAFQNHGIFYNPGPAVGKGRFFRDDIAISNQQLSTIVYNHVLSNKDLTADAITDGFYTAANKSLIIVEGGKLHGFYKDTLATINVENSNIKGFNGYFHEIDKVILNPQQSIYDIINSASAYNATGMLQRPEYTKFKELVIAAGLQFNNFINITSAGGDVTFTLFVPSNTAITNAQVAGLLPKTGAVLPNEPVYGNNYLNNPVGGISDTTKIKRLAAWIRYFFIPGKQIISNGSTTGIMLTSRHDPTSTDTDPVYVPVSISYTGGVLNFNSLDTPAITGSVIMTNKLAFPYDVIAKDGLIHIIDNAFTSRY